MSKELTEKQIASVSGGKKKGPKLHAPTAEERAEINRMKAHIAEERAHVRKLKDEGQRAEVIQGAYFHVQNAERVLEEYIKSHNIDERKI